MNDIHYDVEKIKLLAEHYSKEHKCTYTVIKTLGGTYEYVTDSYFDNHDDYKFIERFEYKSEKTINEIIQEQNTYKITNTYDKYLDLSNITDFGHKGFERGVTYIRETPKVGRNERCDCGCGKKVKKCPNK